MARSAIPFLRRFAKLINPVDRSLCGRTEDLRTRSEFRTGVVNHFTMEFENLRHFLVTLPNLIVVETTHEVSRSLFVRVTLHCHHRQPADNHDEAAEEEAVGVHVVLWEEDEGVKAPFFLCTLLGCYGLDTGVGVHLGITVEHTTFGRAATGDEGVEGDHEADFGTSQHDDELMILFFCCCLCCLFV